MEAINAIFRKWRAHGVPLNPPASDTDLARLEAALGIPLPRDVRYYFSIADGIAEGMEDEEAVFADSWLTNFWPIRKMLSDPWQPSGTDALGQYRDLAFADVMIHSWFICFRVRPESGLSIHVEDAYAPAELPSLEAFFERYLRDPGSLRL